MMLCKNRSAPGINLSLLGLAALLIWENIIVYIILNRDLGAVDDSISGFFRFASIYGLIALLMGIAVYNQYIRKVFRYSWAIPAIYFMLCFYAGLRSEGRTLNSILGFIFRPLVGVACMLSLEYIIACARLTIHRKSIDVLFLFLFGLGLVMTTKQLLYGISNAGHFLAVNNIYFLLPLAAYWTTKKNRIKWVFFLLTLFAALISLKRGAIIAATFMFIGNVYLSRKKRHDLVRSVFIVVFSLFIASTAFQFADDFLFNNYISERFHTISSGSGRKAQFEWALEEISQAPFGVLLVGHGMGASQKKFYGQFIHNDWLLLIYDFGIIGMLIYTCFYVFLLSHARRLWKQRSPYTAAWATCCIFCICLSLYSAVTWLYVMNVLPILGCILGMEQRNRGQLSHKIRYNEPTYATEKNIITTVASY